MNQEEASAATRRDSADSSRLKRIEELRMAIAAGTYHIPVERIAESMIRFAHGRRGLCGELYS